MKKFYYLIAMVACMLFTQNSYAQNKSDLLLNIKGTTQKITTANIDSITFEKSTGNDRNLVLHIKDFTHKFSVAKIDSIAFEKTASEERAPFTAIIDTISELYTTLHIIPDDPNLTYNMFCEPKEAIDLYPNEDSIYNDDKTFYQELADGSGISLREVLEGFLIQGEYIDYNSALLPGEERVMYMYGMTLDGEKTTPMLKIYFKTKTPEMINNKVDIDFTYENGSINATFTPDDNKRYYTSGLFAASNIPDESLIKNKTQQSISNIVVDFLINEEPLSEYLERYASKGTYKMTFNGCDPEEVYYLVAAYLDDECGICSDVTVKAVKGSDIKNSILSHSK